MTALLTITGTDGSTRVHRIPTLTEQDRADIEPHYQAALTAIGCTPAEFLIVLSDLIADREAYERHCARKGLLPL